MIFSCNHFKKISVLKLSVLFETQTLLDKLLRVLKRPAHLSNLLGKWKQCNSLGCKLVVIFKAF